MSGIRPARARPTTAAARAVAAGLVLASLWIVAAAVSGSMSVIARRPLLDGLAPVVPYRWVDPPPALAAANEEPTRLETEVRLGPGGSQAFALSTSDVQATLVMTKGLVRPETDATHVRVRIEPLAAARFPAAPPGLAIAGNVYRVEGTYEPVDEPAGRFTAPAKAVLVYPADATQHSTGHEMLYSSDCERWERLDTIEVIGLQQAESSIRGFGYVAVAGRPNRQGGGPAGEGSSTTLPTVLIVLAGSLALVAIGLAARFYGRRGVSRRR